MNQRQPSKQKGPAPKWIAAVVANARGEIFDLAGYAAVGADGALMAPLDVMHTQPLPHGSELMFLPDRIPLLYDLRRKRIVPLADNPYVPGEPIYPVAAFNSPGYVITHTPAYDECPDARLLPLFSYGAVGWHRGRFRSSVWLVDDEPRQDLRRMPLEKIKVGVGRMRRTLPDNRLRAHLEKCALTYGCPAGKNFFLGRYEAPLPTSPSCNAHCLGCISLQEDSGLTSSQERIGFIPTPEEIAAVALTHIDRVERAVVSFGQGCEGDPLLVADTIAAAIGLIRQQTDQGTINLNTNGSRPEPLARLVKAGLDSVRISMNSVRPDCYHAYFRPTGYTFADVTAAIDAALAHGAHVAINYLNCPGFTDTPEERDALKAFLRVHPVHMIQWRNLNFDPLRYRHIMTAAAPQGSPIGIAPLITLVRRAFPRLLHGYFNPPKERFRRRDDAGSP
ncbi:radical SAM protein [Desulfatitalea alkaliphila]|uniref:Radical SAM protein n=1 Tax=Desulfatitalea alkaliphila TaxID=2929485 RepID=A0AA41R1L4_9BACT|nr:radical SAM protein [Desulfatitalea alkaliphila]MCJ8500379.1 radical SAM protein [Desulfatitalea alkaliphila]